MYRSAIHAPLHKRWQRLQTRRLQQDVPLDPAPPFPPTCDPICQSRRRSTMAARFLSPARGNGCIYHEHLASAAALDTRPQHVHCNCHCLPAPQLLSVWYMCPFPLYSSVCRLLQHCCSLLVPLPEKSGYAVPAGGGAVSEGCCERARGPCSQPVETARGTLAGACAQMSRRRGRLTQ